MNKYFLLFFIFFSFIFFEKNSLAKEISGNPIIIDGDTIKINNQKIRLLGIDAFEKKQECIRDKIKYPCGEISISILETIISGQSVNCIIKKKDIYKRWLGTCFIGELDINENMVLLGYAFSYMSKKYKTTENEAKKVRAGAWDGEFIFPWEWRKLKKK